MKKAAATRVVGFSGVYSTVMGLVPLSFSMVKVNWVVEFLIVDGPASPILGMDFFLNGGIVLDFNNTVVWSKELSVELRLRMSP